MPEINFDLKADVVFNEIKNLPPPPIIFRKIFNKKDVIQQIFPIIFPTGETLDLLKVYFQNKEEKIYKTLAIMISSVNKSFNEINL